LHEEGGKNRAAGGNKKTAPQDVGTVEFFCQGNDTCTPQICGHFFNNGFSELEFLVFLRILSVLQGKDSYCFSKDLSGFFGIWIDSFS
jgi:hypothetical protein